MKAQRPRVGIVGLLGVPLFFLAATGCSSWNRAPQRWSDEPGYSADRRSIVRKPVPPAPNAKPVFLGGYAGASY